MTKSRLRRTALANSWTRAKGLYLHCGCQTAVAQVEEVVGLGSKPGKQPASLRQASTAARRGASSRGYSACGAGRGKGRELLLHPLPPALRALRRFLLACQYKFLKNMSAVGTRILENGHGRPAHSLGLISQMVWFGFPSGAFLRPAQVNREIPGMRGRTRNQTTRKRTQIKRLCILSLILRRSALAGRSRDGGRGVRAIFPDCAHAAAVDGAVRFSKGTQSRHSCPV